MQSITPISVATVVAMSVGRNTDAAFELFAAARRAMTVAGNICIEVAFMTSSNSILSLALPSSLHMLAIAFMPAGVVAPPIPSMFDARFTDM